MRNLIPHWDYLSWARDRFGALFAVKSYLRVLLGLPARIPVDEKNHVYVRPIPGDMNVWHEVFKTREYAIDLGSPKTILDAGAHIGLAAAFLAIRYPQAKIVAVEPDPSNFAMLRRHARLYPNITPIHAGVWSKETNLRISNPGADSWSFIVEESADGFPAVTIDGLMQRFGFDRVDVLKMDIEGSEIEVLNHSAPWIDKVGTLVIELHDRFKPGCREALERATSKLSWKRSVSGESDVLVRAA